MHYYLDLNRNLRNTAVNSKVFSTFSAISAVKPFVFRATYDSL